MDVKGKVLLCDLSNGSHLKIALADPGRRPEFVDFYACAGLADFDEAIAGYLSNSGNPSLVASAFSISGWEVDNHIDLVHFGFALERHYVRSLLGTHRISFVNDATARALAVPALAEDETQLVCGARSAPGDVIAVVGPTVGLGCAYLAPNGRGAWIATHSEGGHSDFAPRNALEIQILKLMMEKYGHVSGEHAVSAPGLVTLWQCLSVIEGETPEATTVDEIVARAYGGDVRAKTAIRVQTQIYASVVSDFALATGAKGGVYLAGSHLTALGTLFDHEVFASRFYDKGRVSSYVKDIPVYKINAEEPEIIGISTLFDDV